MSAHSDEDSKATKRPWRIWLNPTTTAQLLPGDPRRREQICGDIDARGFGWQIWWVSSSGFFTESYNLFATNVVLPCLAYIYWDGDLDISRETDINLVTLVGSIVGQLTFGVLADLFGRRKLYGFELIFVIFGTVGLAGCGSGFSNSMSIMGWLVYYRFFIGVGVGAEYPLAGVITSEFAPAQSRARMMVAVTLMQPLGQVAAAAVSLTILTTLGKNRGLESLTESPRDHEAAAAIIDRIWRIIIGVGAIPAFIAIAARLTIPESPRFTLDVSHDGRQALKANQEYLGQPIADDFDDIVLDFDGSSTHNSVPASATARAHSLPRQAPSLLNDENRPRFRGNPAEEYSHQLQNLDRTIAVQENGDVAEANKFSENHENGHIANTHHLLNGHSRSRSVSPLNLPMAQHDYNIEQHRFEGPPLENPEVDPFSRAELSRYFLREGNWRQLAGCSICWFCLDVAFYGLGIGNPRVIAQIWASSRHSVNEANLPLWGNPADPTLSIYQVLYQNSLHYIITISLGSLLGSIVVVKAIDYVPRKAVLAWSFLALGVTFATVGGIYSIVAFTDLHAFLITFYALLQLLFNLGPNTIIFLLAAEVFPTRYRATCFGISAASGKLGSVVVQAVLPRAHVDAENSTTLNWMLIAFAFVMVLGALFAWAWIPEVQYSRKAAVLDDDGEGEVGEKQEEERRQRERCTGNKIPSMTLETLAEGRMGVENAKRVGLRTNLKKAWRKLRR